MFPGGDRALPGSARRGVPCMATRDDDRSQTGWGGEGEGLGNRSALGSHTCTDTLCSTGERRGSRRTTHLPFSTDARASFRIPAGGSDTLPESVPETLTGGSIEHVVICFQTPMAV